MSKKNLILITLGFPFGEQEQSFLRAEFDELVKHYKVTILTQQTTDPILYPIPQEVRVEQYSCQTNRGWHLLAALPTLAKLFMYPYVRQELKDALHSCPSALKKVRLREIVSFLLQSEQLKAVLEPLAKETNSELIYTYWCHHMTLTAVNLKKKYPHLKVLTRFHGHDLYNERMSGGWQPFHGEIMAWCDQLIFACEAGRYYAQEHWRQSLKSKFITAYLGCRPFPHVQKQSADRLTLLSCSNMIPLKRVGRIIEALTKLPRDMSVQWHHVGGGELEQSLYIQAQQELSSRPNISWKFWGQVTNEALPSLYEKICPELLILLSESEGGAPVSIQEVFSMGIPAIGTAVGGIPELIQTGETGYLLSSDPSPTEVADAITAFYNTTPEQRQNMKNASYTLWKNKFDAKRNAEQFIHLLNTL